MAYTRTVHSQQGHDAEANSGAAIPVAVSLQHAFRVAEPALHGKLGKDTSGILSPIAADLMDVARFLFFADCQVKRPRSWERDLTMNIGVRKVTVWQRREVKENLLNLLHFISSDDWNIEFEARPICPSIVQPCLSFNTPTRVCLMSEGLDSLCGLARQLASDDTDYLAVTALTQYQVYGRVRRTVKQLNSHYGERVYHVPVPMYRTGHQRRPQEEPTQRVRSFLLLALGAVVAQMVGQQSVEIYENGIEMFNFPLAPCLRPELLSRAMHPTLLALMAKFVSTLIDIPFEFTAPFAFQTKGEMVQAARDKVPAEMIPRTVSCIHFPQRKPGAAQCGICSGCLLRRIALHAAGILEPSNSYQSDFASGAHAEIAPSPSGTMWENVYNVDQGVYRLNKGLVGSTPERALMGLSGLAYLGQKEMLQSAGSVGNIASQKVFPSLLRLFSQYASEWKSMRPTIGVLPSCLSAGQSKDQEGCVV